MNKKIITGILIVVLIIVLIFIYGTRAPSAPSQDIDSVVNNSTASTSQNYKISKSSVVEFRIDEILRDKPFTAVGTSSEIAGDISISDDTVTIGTLAINAKTFKTDDERRDGAITRLILKSEDPANEFITFVPTSIERMANSLNITGQLTISGITKPAVFVASINVTDESITGTATSTIKRSDYNLVIPNIPFVASVDDDFMIVTKIVADRVR
jgi:polyisoprenoid-binding protein YceI